MKQTPILAVFLLVLGFSPFSMAGNQTMKVTASGEGSGGTNLTLEQIKQIALADAKRMALEQAGTFIRSKTEVNNFELTKDQIQAFAQGLVKVLKITSNNCSYDDKIKAMNCKVTIEAEVEAIEGKELFERLSQSQSLEKTDLTQGELSFGFNVLAFSPSGSESRGVRIKGDSNQTYQHIELQESGTLHSHDEFQIRFTPHQDAYVYVINVDAHSNVYSMLPNPDGMSENHLKSNQNYILPADGKYYQLDENTGTETIYLIAARQPMPDIDFLLKQSGSQVADLLKASVHTRGISGITQGQQTYQVGQGITIQDVEEQIKGKGAVVRIFKFQHQ